MKKRAGLYIRVSTTEQAENYSVPEQKSRLESYCAAKDYIVAEEYIDAGFSGAKLDRPAMQRLIHDCKNKQLDIVIVWKLDRLSRSQKDTMGFLEDVLIPNSIDFLSINENFDTSTSFGRMSVGLLSVFAQLEREQIRERTSMGRKARAKAGLYHGGAIIPIGYDYVDGHLIINDYEALQVRELYELYVSGRGVHTIQKIFEEKGYTTKCGKWTNVKTIGNVLTSRIYVGEIKYDGEYFPGEHEPIISKKLFDEAQLARTKRTKTAFTSRSLLSGIIWCGKCGSRYFKRNNAGRAKDTYTCYARARCTKRMMKIDRCDNKNWKYDELEDMVIGEVLKLSFDESYFESIKKQEDTPPDNLLILKEKVKSIDNKNKKLLTLFSEDKFPLDLLTTQIENLQNEKDALSFEIARIENIKIVKYDEIKKITHNAEAVFKEGTLVQKRTLLSQLIEKIIIYEDKITIKWTF